MLIFTCCKFVAHTLFCSLSLSLCPFLHLHHARSQFQTFHSDATVHDAIINDGNLPEVTTEINQRILKSDCQNDPDFLYRDQKGKDCLWASGGKGRNRCKKKQPGAGGKKVFFFCPATCKDRCSPDAPTESPVVARGECENDPNFLYKDQEGKDCSWASAGKGRKRCKKKQPGSGNPGKRVLFFCPENCRGKCSTDAPTEMPSGGSSSEIPYSEIPYSEIPYSEIPYSGYSEFPFSVYPSLINSPDLPTEMPSVGSSSEIPYSGYSEYPVSVYPSLINSPDSPSEMPGGGSSSEIPYFHIHSEFPLSVYPSLIGSPDELTSSPNP
jgi:hypothetical protein